MLEEEELKMWAVQHSPPFFLPLSCPSVLLLLQLSSCPAWLFVFRAPLSAKQDCNISVRKASFLWCKAAMTTSAMFHSDLSISVNKCIATLPQTVTHPSGGDTRTLFLIISARVDAFKWKCCRYRCTGVHTQTLTHVYCVLYLCVCYRLRHSAAGSDRHSQGHMQMQMESSGRKWFIFTDQWVKIENIDTGMWQTGPKCCIYACVRAQGFHWACATSL